MVNESKVTSYDDERLIKLVGKKGPTVPADNFDFHTSNLETRAEDPTGRKSRIFWLQLAGVIALYLLVLVGVYHAV